MRTRLIAIVLAGLVAAPVALAADRPNHDIRLFARVPSPGAPAAVVVDPKGPVYTNTLNAESGDTKATSSVFAFSAEGMLIREFPMKGQDTSQQHGLTGMALDAEGKLYVASLAPPIVYRLDPRTGAQLTYGTMRDVPVCGGSVTTDCSKAVNDMKPWPDYVVLAPDGSMYVTDSLQALIWKVPRGGGKAEIWLTDERLQSLIGSPGFGPSAMKLAPDNKTLYFTTVQGPPGDGDPTAGRIWTVPIQPDGKPGELKQLYVAQSADGPGGIGFAKSGKLYVALSGSSQIAVLDASGKELERFPSPSDNNSSPPLDAPVDVAFRGNSLIAANSAFLSNTAANMALLDINVGEPGYDPLRPSMSTGLRALKLKLSPRRVAAGRRVRLRFTVTDGEKPVAGASIRIFRKRARTGANGRGTVTVTIRHRGRKRIPVRKAGYRPGHAFLTAR